MKIDVYWIPETPIGRLAIMPRPRAGDWLEDELQAWHRDGVDVIVCLLTQPELRELGLQNEAAVAQAQGMQFISYPISDYQVPPSISDTLKLVDQIHTLLQAHKGVLIHCQMGIGRSSTIAACVLQKQGLDADTAFQALQTARGLRVPDTDEQRRWATNFGKHLHN